MVITSITTIQLFKFIHLLRAGNYNLQQMLLVKTLFRVSAEYEGKGRVRVLARILSQSSIDIQKKSLSFIYIRSVNKNAVRAKSRLHDTITSA